MENNEDRFLAFLNSAKQSCKTKQDLAKKVDDEINNVAKVKNSPITLQRDAYIRNLNDVKFCLINESFREVTPFRNHILDVLDSLG